MQMMLLQTLIKSCRRISEIPFTELFKCHFAVIQSAINSWIGLLILNSIYCRFHLSPGPLYLQVSHVSLSHMHENESHKI